MAILIPDTAATYSLDQWVDARDTYYHLYVSPIALSHATTLASFVRPTWRDYAPQRVTTWTDAILFAGVATSWADPCVWVTGAVGTYPITIRGYYVTDAESDYLLWCEMAPAPVVLTGAGQAISVQPRIQWGSLPS